MRPVIGVPLRYNHLPDGRPVLYLGEKVRRTLQKAKAEVFTLTPVQDLDYADTKGNEFPELSEEEKQIINKNLDRCDGLLLPGGNKFTPYDRYILEYAIEKKIPTLGICLSMQMMSCYNDCVQMVKNETDINHNQENDNEFSHLVKISKDSKLFQIIGKEEIRVNSFHNYHVTENAIYNISAISEDGLIEALEYPASFFNIGIQWHPEISYDFDDDSKKIIDYFIDEAVKNKEKKEVEV